MTFSILEHPEADDDLTSIVRFIQKRSPRGANAWLKAYIALLEVLQQFPLSFPPALERRNCDFDVRQAYFKTRSGRRYRVIFVVEGDVVHILRIRGPHQDLLSPEDLEFE